MNMLWNSIHKKKKKIIQLKTNKTQIRTKVIAPYKKKREQFVCLNGSNDVAIAEPHYWKI